LAKLKIDESEAQVAAAIMTILSQRWLSVACFKEKKTPDIFCPGYLVDCTDIKTSLWSLAAAEKTDPLLVFFAPP